MAQGDLGIFGSLQDIGSSVGDFARQKQALALAEQQRQQQLADTINLFRQQQQIKQEFATPPSALEQLIEQAKGAEAAKTLGNEALSNQIRGQQQLGQQLQPQQIEQPRQPTREEFQANQSLVGPEDLVTTKGKPGDFGRFQPTEIISKQGQIQKGVLSEAVKASGKQLDSLLKTTGNLSRVESAMSGMVAQAKRAVNEQGGFGAKQAIIARAKRFGQRLGLGEPAPLEEQFGGLAGLDSQRQETILALSPILTGQNRVLRSALTMIKKTVPDLPITGTTEAEFGENLRQSLKNSFKLSLGIAKGLLTPEEIANLNQNASEGEIVAVLEEIMNRTAFTERDEETFSKLFDRVIKTSATTPVGLFKSGEQKFGTFQGTRQSQQPISEIDSINAELEAINKELGE